MDEIKKYLSKRKEVIFAYIYGSVAREKENRLSDIDIAIFVDEKKKPESGIFGYRSELITELQPLVDREVDLVILNNVSNFFAFNVLKNGKLLFSRSKRKRIEFHREVMIKYLDFLPVYNIQDYYLNKRLKEGRFGR